MWRPWRVPQFLRCHCPLHKILFDRRFLNELTESKTSSVNIAAIDFIRDQLGNRANLKIDSAINTGANLSSSVFNNVLLSVGIDPSPYEPRYHFIDESLLKRRNNIAHGERSDVLSGDWTHIADEVIIMLRYLKNDIENATALEAFKR